MNKIKNDLLVSLRSILSDTDNAGYTLNRDLMRAISTWEYNATESGISESQIEDFLWWLVDANREDHRIITAVALYLDSYGELE